MKIIDFRFRPNTPEIINGIKNSSMFKATCEAIGFDKRVPQALPEIVADLDRRGVELCVVSGRDCETTYGFPANNNSILEFCRAYPNKFLGFWGIDPHKGMDAVREVEHVIKDLGMRGIATDPYLAHCPPSDARYYPIYAKCVELGVPVFVTTAPPAQVPRAIMDYIDPRQIDVVARDFPELILIMSHGGYPFVNEAIFACMRNANVYMDLSEYDRRQGHLRLRAPVHRTGRRHRDLQESQHQRRSPRKGHVQDRREDPRPRQGRFPQYREAHGSQRLQQRQVPAAVPALRPDGTLGFCGELRFRAVPWCGNAPRPAELFWVTRG